MLIGVSAERWRIILAHELAHVRRHDASIDLLQMLVESLLFFNPARR
jgi:beta-lactamase regulating signal transducer with metallopeptidase domain